MIGPCVIDASVGIKLFVREEGTELVELIFAGLDREPPVQLFVPDIFFVECANILWKYVRRFNYSTEDARSDLRDLLRLNLDAIAGDELLAVAFNLALDYSLTVYDACYLALAGMLELPLITADECLFNKMEGKPYDIRLLNDMEHPTS